jgi:hypothetical protein
VVSTGKGDLCAKTRRKKMSGKTKGKGENRARAKIYPRRPTRPPATTPTGSEDAEAMAIFAGGGLFDPSVKDEISQVFATILFSENSPVLQQEEVREVRLTGKREDSSVLFSLERLSNPTGKGDGAQPPIDPISGLIDVRRLVATSTIAAGDATDSVIYIRGMGFQSGHDTPVLPVLPRRTSLLTKAVAIFGAVLAMAGIVVLCVFALTEDEGFDVYTAPAAEPMAATANRVAVPTPNTDLKNASLVAIDDRPDAPQGKENLASPSTPVKVAGEARKRTRQSASPAGSRQAKAAKRDRKPSREKVGRVANDIDALLDGAISEPSRERSNKKPRRISRAEAEAAAASKPHKLSRAQVQSGLGAVSWKVRQCGQGQPSGIITVEVVIKGNGRVARVRPIGSFVGTSTGACVARAVRGASFPEFTGPRMTIQYPYRF